MAYLVLDPSSNVTVLPLTVSWVPGGDVRENSYVPEMSKKSRPVYLTAKLYFLAATASLTPFNDIAAACKFHIRGLKLLKTATTIYSVVITAQRSDQSKTIRRVKATLK